MPRKPVYAGAVTDGRLARNVRAARRAMRRCVLCPRRCAVNRLAGETGICRTGTNAWIASAHPHFGEEPELVGTHGSGTIFFTYCNLCCKFCQNEDISRDGVGREVSTEQLSGIMLDLQDQGCHNINLVTPSHVVPAILEAVLLAAERGLRVPLVYNSSGYDSLHTLRLLDGIVDIYMPDFKFWDHKVAEATCDAPDYPEAARRAIREMHRQVGVLKTDARGIANRGLLIRHLVLPDGLAGTDRVAAYITEELDPDTYVNIMPQYRPCADAGSMPPLDRRLKPSEFADAITTARRKGLKRLSGW